MMSRKNREPELWMECAEISRKLYGQNGLDVAFPRTQAEAVLEHGMHESWKSWTTRSRNRLAT